MTETTVFQSGNSQAVRLPTVFRLKSKTVESCCRGDEVVLHDQPRTLGNVLASLPPLMEEEAAEWDAVLAAFARTEALLLDIACLPITAAVAAVHAQVRAALRRLGTPIGRSGHWIAAHAPC